MSHTHKHQRTSQSRTPLLVRAGSPETKKGSWGRGQRGGARGAERARRAPPGKRKRELAGAGVGMVQRGGSSGS